MKSHQRHELWFLELEDGETRRFFLTISFHELCVLPFPTRWTGNMFTAFTPFPELTHRVHTGMQPMHEARGFRVQTAWAALYRWTLAHLPYLLSGRNICRRMFQYPTLVSHLTRSRLFPISQQLQSSWCGGHPQARTGIPLSSICDLDSTGKTTFLSHSSQLDVRYRALEFLFFSWFS